MFNKIRAELARKGGNAERTMMIDATHLKARFTAVSLLKGACSPTLSDARKGL